MGKETEMSDSSEVWGFFWLSITLKLPGPYFYIQLAISLNEFFVSPNN